MVGAIFDGTRLPGPEVFSKNQKIVDINVEKWTEKVTVVKVTLMGSWESSKNAKA